MAVQDPLVVDVLTHLKSPLAAPIPEVADTRHALARFLSEIVRAHGSQPTDRILAGLVGAMSQDPELAEAVRAGSFPVAERPSAVSSSVGSREEDPV